MHISLITSLYRSEKFLPQYVKRLLDTGSRVVQAQLSLEVLVIANAATSVEREMISDLVKNAQTFAVKPLYVPRESLYASWNRAVKAASGQCIGMWNVDDDRTSEALIEGYRLISGGCDLVDFPYTLVKISGEDGREETQRQDYTAFPYNLERFNPVYHKRTGPFFMYARGLYDRTGPFDERFKVCGDAEWTMRASARAKFCSGTAHGGTYYIHGKNLSTSELLQVEENIVLMLYPGQHQWQGLNTTNPKLMKATWGLWQTPKLPPSIERKLWGPKAILDYHFQKRYTELRNKLSAVITKSGLRPFLAKIGILESKTDPLLKRQRRPSARANQDVQQKINEYMHKGSLPWSSGYYEYKMQLVDKALSDEDMLAAFRQSKPLPEGYGAHIDERVIEFPWVYAHLKDAPTLLLDAGSTLNYASILCKPLFEIKTCVIYTLAPEDVYSKPNVSYIYGDLRNIMLRDNWFDEITCISTLEHVGMDNTLLYTRDKKYAENEQMSYVQVLKEFNRVLKTGGRLLLTVPYGKPQNMGWQQQFDQPLLQRAIDAFGGQVTEKVFYKYTAQGWQISDEASCASCEYFDVHASKEFDADYAAAARAVACLEILKV